MNHDITQKRETRHSRFGGMWVPLAVLLVLVASTGHGQSDNDQGPVITIEGARIQGEQELPTVLYLVPWQPVASKGPEPMERRLMTGERPARLERESFRRRLDYHQTDYQIPRSNPHD